MPSTNQADMDADAALLRRLQTAIERIRSEVSELGDSAAVATLRQRLDQAEEDSRRDRFTVGLFGPPKAGKTSTLRNLLREAEAVDLLPMGAGGPASPFPTRIFRATGAPGAGGGIELVYLTPHEYRERRAEAIGQAGLDPDARDAEILSRLEQLLARDAQIDGPIATRLRQLQDLLRGYESLGGERIKSPRMVESVAPADYRRVLAGLHASGVPAGPLIAEVRIPLRVEGLPHGIELVDMPGLDGLRRGSGARAGRFAEMDATVLFFPIDLVGGRDLVDLMEAAGKQGVDPSTIWLVLTKCDALPADLTTSEEVLRDSVIRPVHELKISPDRVHFVSNVLGHPDIEPIHDDPPSGPQAAEAVLVEAFRRASLPDGGLGRLRIALFESLPQQLEFQRRSRVGAELQAIARDLGHVLRAAAARSRLGVEGFTGLILWRNLLTVLTERARDGAQLIVPADDLTARLGAAFQAICPSDLPLEGPNLRVMHQNAATLLRALVFDEVRAVTAPRAFAAFRDRIAAAEADLGPIPVSGAPGVLAAWSDAAEVDCSHMHWLSETAEAFVAPPLFHRQDPVFLDGPAYRALMARKIRIVAQSAARLILGRIAEQLGGLRADVDRQIEGIEQIRPESAEVLVRLAESLR